MNLTINYFYFRNLTAYIKGQAQIFLDPCHNEVITFNVV